jgi:hypothetical protein
VRKRTQVKNKLAGSWTKRSKKTGEFIDVKKSPKKFKGVRREKAARASITTQARHKTTARPGARMTSATLRLI